MAEDKMKNPDQEKYLGGKTGSEGQGGQYGGGQQAPGRNPQDDRSSGQRPGQGQGIDNEIDNEEDEGFGKRPGSQRPGEGTDQ
jgi:hypothetical protein